MKTMTVVSVAIALAFATLASARPLVIQENARIVNPDPANYPDFPIDLAVDGDDAMISMRIYHQNWPDGDDEADNAVWLFRRVNGTWMPVRRLIQDHDYPYGIHSNGISMQNGVAALAMHPLYIFERRNGDWVQAGIDYAGHYLGPGDDIEIDAGRIFYGASDGPWSGTLFLRDATGVWRATQTLYGDLRGGDDEYEGGPVDLSGGRAIVLSPYAENTEYPVSSPTVTAFRQFPDSAFYPQSRIENDPDRWPLGYEAAVRGDEIFIAGTDRTGTHVFRPGPSDSWIKAPDTQLRPLDSHMGGGTTYLIRKNELFIFQHNYDVDRDGYVINVFARNAANVYDHVATLAASGNDDLYNFQVSGRRVIANCEGEACVFDLPASLAQPAVVQDTFGGASPTGWSTSAGSQFTVAQSGVSRVLRQSETASPATHTAILTASNWTNQSVQADVRATAFAGTDRWLGLATRYSDAANHYYVTLRSSGSVSLKRMRGGTFTTLASAPVTVTPNRTYRLRIQSIGTRHRVFVDGIPLLDVDDATLASGRAALLTYRTAAEFDNVVASPTPAATLFRADSFFQGGPTAWTHTGPGLWTGNDDGVNSWFGQYSVAGDARAIVGVPTDDQAIDVRARPTTFAGTGTGDRWFGAMARYVDDSNYYYLSVRSSNTVSLRKLVNGSITVLASTTLPVSLGTWYSLRIEAVGSRIRGYVNGVLTLEAEDSSHASGATGLVTYRAAADFDDYRAIQP
jgi:hypothetical protein